MFKYETHLHTSPASRCARASVRESLEFYKKMGYDGVFITNHFVNHLYPDVPYEEKIDMYFADYEEGAALAEEIGIKVFCGVEMDYHGSHFLVYGLDKDWYKMHPELRGLECKQMLETFVEAGAFVIHAHPYREAKFIDHIRLFPRNVHGVEVVNGNLGDLGNKMGDFYAEGYNLLKTAGTDNHVAGETHRVAGIGFETPIESVDDYAEKLKAGEGKIFTLNAEDFYGKDE